MAFVKRPNRQRTNASSNSRLFEKRGNPWVSEKEGLNDYGRVLAFENPDMDCFTRASRAPEKFERGPEKPIQVKTVVADKKRRLANIRIKLNRELNRLDRLKHGK